jgi:hypothetical protein
MRQIQSVSGTTSDPAFNPADNFTELFKAQVAARIGREPHEILLKRQGERPFKDQLTLEDYGVSNGVQLDLLVLLVVRQLWEHANNSTEKSIPAIDQSEHTPFLT